MSTHSSRFRARRRLAAAGAALGLTATVHRAGRQSRQGRHQAKILNYNPQMEYRRCGKTELMISAVCMGGHWKRIDKVVGRAEQGQGLDRPRRWQPGIREEPPRRRQPLHRSRHQLHRRLREPGGAGLQQGPQGPPRQDVPGLLLVRGRDATWARVAAAAKAASRNRPVDHAKLKDSFDHGLKQAGLEYVDLWRITCHEGSSAA